MHKRQYLFLEFSARNHIIVTRIRSEDMPSQFEARFAVDAAKADGGVVIAILFPEQR